ncbi:MAG: LCP family protein [Anaerolineales bacterium]|nr:LCP family protein [Anaerolineales bacterium]
MTKSQRAVIAVLSLVAVSLVAALGIYAYQTLSPMARTPLGPALPLIPTQTVPPLWTLTPADLSSASTPMLAPTILPTATQPAPLCGGPPLMNVLVIGADVRGDNYLYGLGDAIRLVRVDFVTPKVSVLEFPRDLWVEIPHISEHLNGQDHEKLNQAYLYGQPGFKYWDDPSGGPGLTALTLNLNFGANVDHYIAVNMRTFEHVIDAMGGIEVNIPDKETARMSDLAVGVHKLNGAQALKLARNRTSGIFKRADNQNLVLCGVRKKLTNPAIIAKVPAMIQTFQDNIRTDFTPEQLGQLACLASQMPKENIVFSSFPEELFTSTRVYDPVFDKRVSIVDADFNILSDYVARFQAGLWPLPSAKLTDSPAEADADENSVFTCE